MSQDNNVLPPPDDARIAADTARGIKFSEDGRTLIAYNRELSEDTYAVPEEVTGIGDNAFECADLKSVNVHAGVTSIGFGAFAGVEKVEIASENKSFFADPHGAVFDRKKGALLYLPPSFCGWYDIPDGATVIGDLAFRGCCDLKGITIPASVTGIGKLALAGVKRVEIEPENRAFFADSFGAVFDSTGSTLLYFPREFSGEYAIPQGVTSIGDMAFSRCSGLTGVDIPVGVTSIGKSEFEDCVGLERVVIPEGVTTIGDMAFRNCSRLKEAAIPDSVKSIGDMAFSRCSSLTDVTIPGSVASIGQRAFYWCLGLTSVNIGDGVTGIGVQAFQGCLNLKVANVPRSVVDFGDAAFKDCPCEVSIKLKCPNYD